MKIQKTVICTLFMFKQETVFKDSAFDRRGNCVISGNVYDNQEIIAELDEYGQTLVSYTHSGRKTDDVLSMQVSSEGVNAGIAPNSGSYYFQKDAIGSVINIVNGAGTVVQHHAYSSFREIAKIMNGVLDNTSNPNFKVSYSFAGSLKNLRSNPLIVSETRDSNFV